MIGATEFSAGALDKRFYGVVVGIVTAHEDPLKQGRVKLRFPWYDNQTETDWARVVYLNAGPSHGFIAAPELDTEVLVAFEHGDMRRPYVLGGLYNGVDTPPTDRQGDSVKDEKLFQTRAGHRLLLRDTKGEELIELKTKGGHTLVLKDPGKSGNAEVVAKTSDGHSLQMDDTGKKVTLATTGGHKLEFDEGGKKITLTTATGQSVVINGTGTITLTATTVKLEATQVELGTGASQGVILGDAFMAYFNTHVHTSTAPTAPTSPPVVPMLPALVSKITKTG